MVSGRRRSPLGALWFGKRPVFQHRTRPSVVQKAMIEFNLGAENPTDLPKRAVRALTEKMTVLPDTGRVKNADDLFLVVSESGSEYLVDTREGRCDCPDAEYNLEPEERCKHERRVAYATGSEPIPLWADQSAIDPQLGDHTEAVLSGAVPPAFPELLLVGHTPSGETLRTDGGARGHRDDTDACPNGDPDCDGPESDDLPCFACFEVDQ